MKLSKALFISLLLTHSLANAQSYVYVTDVVDIPMRSSNKIERDPPNLLKMLPSGTKLEILSTENGWTKVKYEKTIGWMISRYLTSKIPAQAQLEKLRQTYNANKLLIAKQGKRNAELEAQVQTLKNKNTLFYEQNRMEARQYGLPFTSSNGKLCTVVFREFNQSLACTY